MQYVSLYCIVMLSRYVNTRCKSRCPIVALVFRNVTEQAEIGNIHVAIILRMSELTSCVLLLHMKPINIKGEQTRENY